MMRNTFEANDVALGNLFSDDYVFTMPVYQRPYSWTTDETGELLTDLLGAMEAGDSQEPDPYFLGSIVLISRPNSSTHEVIDGQQRLTTLTILFCVLRELTEDGDKSLSLDRRVRETRDVFAGGRDRFRLSIRERDQDFFRDNVQSPNKIADFVSQERTYTPDSRKLIFQNAKFLWEELSALSEERRDQLSEFLIQRCYLVVVSAYDRDSAHRIFSVLNARGLDLTPTDILKADVVGDIRGDDQDSYTRVWEDKEDELGREGFREVFAHIYVIKTRNRFHKELAKAFKDDVLKSSNGSVFIDDTLMPFAESFQVVTNADYESAIHAENINHMLSYLIGIRNDNDDWIPLAMLFHNRYKDSPATFLNLLEKLDRLAYAMFVIGVRRDPRITRYRPAIIAVENDAESDASALLGVSSPLDLTREERADALTALDGSIYRPRPVARFARPLLLRLNSTLTEPDAIYNYKTVTVEHVLPQSPDPESEWVRDFPDEDVRLEWLHRLANLVLLSRSKNSRAQNYEFARKKSEYFFSGPAPSFTLTNQLRDESEWTPRILERRQRQLIDALKAEWAL